MTGTLYGLGVGPGDPNLLTLKARDVIASSPVIAYPAPEGGESLVRAIAAPHIPAGRIEIVVRTPMVVERFPAQDVYDLYALELVAHLQAGRDVAFLCEGDPFLYGSFMYIFERIAASFPTRVVPGVSSLCAVAAAAGKPLVSRNEVLTILPAPIPEAELTARLASADAAAIMKVGRHLEKVQRVLTRLNLIDDAWYVERATMAGERVMPMAALDETDAPYFSMILVRRGRPRPEAGMPVVEWEAVPPGAAIVVLNEGGVQVARRLKQALPGSSLHGLAGRVAGVDQQFHNVAEHLRQLFAAGAPIVALFAAGIVIRALAPLIEDKRKEPPVLAVAEDGSAIVPLLGGHHGANRLARVIGAVTGGIAAITTAGDARLGFGLDDPPPGWRMANPERAKPVMAALLRAEPVSLVIEAGEAGWLTRAGVPFVDGAENCVRVTDRKLEASDDALVLHPPVLAVGVGCERGSDAEEVIALADRALADADLSRDAVAVVASLDLKADEAAVHALAAHFDVPARLLAAQELEAQRERLANPSDLVFREVGCHGVAEGAALAAAGPDAVLIVEKTKSKRATCAIARAPRSIDPLAVGRSRGKLTVIGIGPGQTSWRTPEATAGLQAATDVVGYGLYLDLVADVIGGKRLHTSELSEEEARVRKALDLAAAGSKVALISSGDAGIYGMAPLVFELLDQEDRRDWNRIDVSVVPGVTALQAAAARVGAAIGHDFCAISLSDLLTPWSAIERRLKAAADADFVVALYNPVSRRRQQQLVSARDILLAVRDHATPVAVARNLGRKGESIRIVTLGSLQVEDVDMLTLVLVGNSASRMVERCGRPWFYTPRGYAAKMDPGREEIATEAS